MGLYIKGSGFFYFKYHQSTFDTSYRNCAEAIAMDRLLKVNSTDVDSKLIDRNTSILKIACLDLKKITNHLIEFGVTEKQVESHIGILLATPKNSFLLLNKPSIFNE